MNKKWLYIFAPLCFCPSAIAGPPGSSTKIGHEIVAGVDMDAVDWEKLCSSLQPVTVTRGGVTCKNVYPTSSVVRRYEDFSGSRPDAPPLNCDMLGREFKKYITPKASRHPWSHCRYAFRSELIARSSGRMAYDDMPFTAWRTKYFAKWTVLGVSQ